MLAQPHLHVGAEGDDADAGSEGVVQRILYQPGGETLPGIVLADYGVVKNPLGPLVALVGQIVGFPITASPSRTS
ncbi:hypothetical protein ABIB27_001819 [Arthrobacter sp. UYEF21]